MKIAMGSARGAGATVVGFLQAPKINEALHKFLEPTFARLAHLRGRSRRPTPCSLIGLVVGAGLGLLGIFIAYQLWVVHPERPRRDAGALRRPCTGSS